MHDLFRLHTIWSDFVAEDRGLLNNTEGSKSLGLELRHRDGVVLPRDDPFESVAIGVECGVGEFGHR